MPERIEELIIDRTLLRARLDTWLRSQYPAISRGAIQRLIEQGHITIDGRAIKPTHSPRAGERVRICWPEARPAEALPEELPLSILFEDEALLVLDKKPGMVVHPGAGNEEHTLVNALLHHCAGQLSGVGGVARPGIVHRLDKETSGCLVVAKNDETHLALSSQFASRKVGKTYEAIVCGELERGTGHVRAGIARHPSHRKRMAVHQEGGREAWTSYSVLERLRSATLVQAVLHTGRTHQIRVHFQFLGHPLVGDLTYGQRQNVRLEELTHYSAPRQMLHSRSLAFIHPRTGRKVTFESPRPADFLDALAALRIPGE